MPRKPKKPAGGEESPKKSTAVVRIDADLARMASIISTATGEDVSDILSPLLRKPIETRYAEVVRQLGQEIKEK